MDAAARKVVEDAGFGPGYKYFAHRVGHGIGLEGHEYPYLVKGNTLKLEPGMTFCNEPGIYIYGEFGIRTEDCMVVTEDGARHLGGMEAVSIDQPFADRMDRSAGMLPDFRNTGRIDPSIQSRRRHP